MKAITTSERKILIILWMLFLSVIVHAQTHKIENEYQFHTSLSFTDANGNQKNTVVYLWVPPKSRQLKGVIIASQNVLEQWLLEHPLIRAACTASDLAIAWGCPGFFVDGKTHYPQINIATIQRFLDSLAFTSGYDELSHIPWLPIGHSGTNNLVSVLVDSVPQKLIAAIKMKGGPGFNTANVPVMCNAGEYFEWNQHKEDLIHPKDSIPNYISIIKERKTKHNPLTYFFDPNTGHFDCSEALTACIADYITAVCKFRFSDTNDGGLLPIDLNKGWITGLPLPGAKSVAPKPYAQAIDEEKNLPWYFTKQQAELAYQLAFVNFKRKPQMVSFAKQDGTPAGYTRGIVWPIPYVTEDDGITFTLPAVFLNSVPDTFLYANTPLQHNQNKPEVILLSGNAKYKKENSFEIFPSRTYKAATTYFIIRQNGDDSFRTYISPGQLVLNANDKGLPQKISFSPIENITSSAKSFRLKATSDKALPVRFYVKSGPATVKGNKLSITTIPVKAKFPIRVTVVAWQWGRASDPPIQTAPFTEQSFYIFK